MKMDNNNFLFQDQEEEEEEAISLRDFPLTPDENNHHTHTDTTDLSPFQDLWSTSEQSDLFEFLNNHNSNMSHAEDIIYCGKLIPFKDQDDQSPSSIYQTQNQATPNNNDHHKLHNFQRRRSDSLSELKTYRSNSSSSSSSSKTRMRNSRSLDYQKLSRNSSMSSNSPNSRSSSRFDGTLKIPKPRWYVIMFGSVKFPPEMDLRDIKNRQVQRTVSPPLFPSLEVVKKVPVSRKSPWEVLKVLSCRDDASVNVTTSLACMPRV